MALKRRRFSRAFTRQVVREVEAGKPPAQAAREYQVHPTMIVGWPQEHLQYAERALTGSGRLYKEEARIAARERLLGQLTMEHARLNKALLRLDAPRPGAGRPWRAAIIELITAAPPAPATLPVTRRWQVLGLNRATYDRWRAAEPAPDPDIDLRAQLQAIALELPADGSRRITHERRRQGMMVNHQRVVRLLREDNLPVSAPAGLWADHRLHASLRHLSQSAAGVDGERPGSPLGRGYHVYPLTAGLRLPGPLAGCLESPLHRLGARATPGG